MTCRRAVADAMAMKTVKSTKNLTFQALAKPTSALEDIQAPVSARS